MIVQRKMKLWLFLCSIIYLTAFTLPVNARTIVDTNAETGITIQYDVPGAEFSIYKVADVTEYYRFPVTEDFTQYSVDFDALNSDEWKNMAETLAGYVVRDDIEPFDEAVTDQEGKIVFDDISVGVYLIIGSQMQDENYIYRCKPFLVFLPEETEDGEWNYHPECRPKFADKPIELLDISVIKIWKDEGAEDSRPEEIVIQLLKDGEVFEEINLNAENNWRFTWEDLSSEFTWQAAEKEVPDGYTVEVIQEGSVIQVINTTEKTPEKPEKLPQTGQTWWPVPVLIVGGLLCILIGLVRRKVR